MAWPRSRMRTYIANGVPVIAADDLNGMQDWIIAFTLNEVTITGLAMDGVGGAAATAEPNIIKWTGTAGGGNPTRTTAVLNKSMPLNTCKAWLYYKTDGLGSFAAIDGIDGFNILAVSYPAADQVRVQLSEPMANVTYSVMAQASLGADALFPSVDITAANVFILDFSKADHTDFTGAGPVSISPRDGAGIEISLHVFGRQTS